MRRNPITENDWQQSLSKCITLRIRSHLMWLHNWCNSAKKVYLMIKESRSCRAGRAYRTGWTRVIARISATGQTTTKGPNWRETANSAYVYLMSTLLHCRIWGDQLAYFIQLVIERVLNEWDQITRRPLEDSLVTLHPFLRFLSGSRISLRTVICNTNSSHHTIILREILRV